MQLQPLTDDLRDGRIKLYMIWRTLALRNEWPEVFRDGDYLPLSVTGENAEHVCAYARRCNGRIAITIIPRLTARLLGSEVGLPTGAQVWGDTALELPPELAGIPWSNRLTGQTLGSGEQLAVAEVLAHFPAALLTGERGE